MSGERSSVQSFQWPREESNLRTRISHNSKGMRSCRALAGMSAQPVAKPNETTVKAPPGEAVAA